MKLLFVLVTGWMVAYHEAPAEVRRAFVFDTAWRYKGRILLGVRGDHQSASVACRPESDTTAFVRSALSRLSRSADTTLARILTGYGVPLGVAPSDVTLISDEAICVAASRAVETVLNRRTSGVPVGVYTIGNRFVVDLYSSGPSESRSVFVFALGWVFQGYLGISNM